jgi:hypothetical protein
LWSADKLPSLEDQKELRPGFLDAVGEPKHVTAAVALVVIVFVVDPGVVADGPDDGQEATLFVNCNFSCFAPKNSVCGSGEVTRRADWATELTVS